MRNQNGFGSIVCLDKTGKKRRKPWTVRITVGWKNGRQVRKYLGYYKTQTEALIALAEYHNTGIGIDLSNKTLNETFDLWIERIKKKELSDSVVAIHMMAYSRFGQLGKMLIKDVKHAHLQDWMDGINLKAGSKRKLKSTLVQLFDYAMTNDMVQKNYASKIEINEKIEKTGSIFTDEEIAKLWEHQNDDEAQQLLILIYTGMRIGELLKIKRENIHFDEQYIIGGIKTEAGKDRVIPLHDKIVPFVKQQLGDNKYLIGGKQGTGVVYTTARKAYVEYMTKLGMKHKIHDTRKTAVSIMHSSGIPIETVRIIVGHSGKGVTEKVYIYKTPSELVEAINTIKIL